MKNTTTLEKQDKSNYVNHNIFFYVALERILTHSISNFGQNSNTKVVTNR